MILFAAFAPINPTLPPSDCPPLGNDVSNNSHINDGFNDSDYRARLCCFGAAWSIVSCTSSPSASLSASIFNSNPHSNNPLLWAYPPPPWPPPWSAKETATTRRLALLIVVFMEYQVSDSVLTSTSYCPFLLMSPRLTRHDPHAQPIVSSLPLVICFRGCLHHPRMVNVVGCNWLTRRRPVLYYFPKMPLAVSHCVYYRSLGKASLCLWKLQFWLAIALGQIAVPSSVTILCNTLEFLHLGNNLWGIQEPFFILEQHTRRPSSLIVLGRPVLPLQAISSITMPVTRRAKAKSSSLMASTKALSLIHI
mgnify:CR=1 FL=1